MTLYRQLLLFILTLLSILLLGTWAAKLQSTRAFLADQLSSHAQDTATSLGLSISTLAAEGDVAAMEAMVSAVFDRGYYRHVAVRDLAGVPLVERQLAVTVEGVPGWFVHLIPLETPDASAFIMRDWQRLGTIYVQSHPGYAYLTLWRTVSTTTLWFLLAGAVVALVGGWALHLLLRPLKRVEHQALALCRRHYEIQERLPRTRELRQVVEAMNRMTGKVRQMFDEQATIAEQLRKNAYLDSLTGLGNRRYIEGQIATRLDTGEAVKGALLLIRLHGLQRINRESGFQAGDALVVKGAEIIGAAAAGQHSHALGRLTGGDFALLLPDSDEQEARAIAGRITGDCAHLHGQGFCPEEEVCHVGAALYEQRSTAPTLLALADQALRQAQQDGPNRSCLLRLEGAASVAARSTLLALLQKTLAQRRIRFLRQPALTLEETGAVLHQELLARIEQEDGRLLPAGLFIPLAEQGGLMTALDRVVVEAVLQLAPAVVAGQRLAVNLSPLSLENSEFRQWLAQVLPQARQRELVLDLEFAEYAAVRFQPRLRELALLLRQHGHRLGIDNFGQGLANFGYLHSLHPDYIKIERALTAELHGTTSDAYFFVGSVCAVAHSLDIQVIAKGVENDGQLQLLRELHVDGVQGYHFGQPEPLPREERG